MNTDDVLRRLRESPNINRISKDLKIPYATLHNWYTGKTGKPSSQGIDRLREYFQRQAQ